MGDKNCSLLVDLVTENIVGRQINGNFRKFARSFDIPTTRPVSLTGERSAAAKHAQRRKRDQKN